MSRPKTGILKLLERDKSGKEEGRETFDDYLKGHIRRSNKTINIRGLFRVPDVAGGERLMINAEEKEPEASHEEQILELPMESDEALQPDSKAMMSYPLGKSFLSPEVIDIQGKQPIDYYIDLAKQQPGKKLAFIHKRTRSPYILN